MTTQHTPVNKAEALNRLTNRYNEQVERYPLMRDNIPLALYIRRNIKQVMRNGTLASYSTTNNA
jgi:hypothetical protein